ncbi:unnamed protein product [Echinostoma caproni]|uniref:Uncharacterized protein n=1 Tax=Echinostoma caproni TaxID=27848 RepID=A0A183B9V2_9TREM|nr:unnamed protein product [Echinostoma caproni]
MRRFPKDQLSVTVLSFITWDAADRAFQANVFDGDDLQITFSQLRELLDTPLHPVKYQKHLLAARGISERPPKRLRVA